jgi:putative MATE family efflux protein
MEKVFQNIGSVWQFFLLSLKGKEMDSSRGNLNKIILLMAIPMVLEMFMESLFSIVDIFFVSRLGINSVSAVGLTETLMTVIYSVGLGIGMAGTALIARRTGEKDFNRAGLAAVQVILLSIVFSIVTGILGFIFAGEMLALLGASPAVIKEGKIYTQWVFAGNITVTLLFVINGIFRGAGNAGIALHALWIANLLNIILNPILIFGLGPIPAMGLEGAAIATVTGRTLGVIFQLYILLKKSTFNLQIKKEHFKLKVKTLKKLSMLSIGGMGQFVIESVSWLLLIKIVSLSGNAALAAYTITYRIIMFTLLPGWGMANVSATLVGQNLGAGEVRRAERSVWKTTKLNMIFLGFFSLVFFLFPNFFVSLFTSDPDVIREGIKGLQLFSIGFIFFAIGMVLAQSINGAGDTKTPTIINIIVFIAIQIPLAYFLAITLKMGAGGVYLAITICYSIHALLNYIVIKQGHWKKVTL